MLKKKKNFLCIIILTAKDVKTSMHVFQSEGWVNIRSMVMDISIPHLAHRVPAVAVMMSTNIYLNTRENV